MLTVVEASFDPEKLRLLGNRVLIEPLPKPTVSQGGITLLPDYNDDRSQWRVVAVGPGKKLKDGTILPVEMKPGDKVLCPNHSFVYLDNGMRIVDAGLLEMKWDY